MALARYKLPSVHKYTKLIIIIIIITVVVVVL
jgi:hypothetical protein